MNIENFITQNVNLTFKEKNKLYVLDSKYIESVFNAIKIYFVCIVKTFLCDKGNTQIRRERSE